MFKPSQSEDQTFSVGLASETVFMVALTCIVVGGRPDIMTRPRSFLKDIAGGILVQKPTRHWRCILLVSKLVTSEAHGPKQIHLLSTSRPVQHERRGCRELRTAYERCLAP